MEQGTIFDLLYERYTITKPIRLLEMFAGYGSQAYALKSIGVQFEHHKICEWATKSIDAYNNIHIRDYTDYSNSLTDAQVLDFLCNSGISMNYNEPMTREQIKRKSIEWQRKVYNNIIATHNLVDINRVHAKDLEIEDRNYEYILTYSFPCQDLSLSGKKLGMSKDSGTRSGLLWQVERILLECKEIGTMPNVLIMENVPEVCGANNVEDFRAWVKQLQNLGYSNFMQILNAKDYGIPQNRNRCFMVSILGDWSYHFPTPIKLKYKLKDFLEKTVNEKYYLSSKQIEDIKSWNAHEKPLEKMEQTEKSVICPTITTRTGDYTSSMILVKTKDTQFMKQELCDNLIQSGKVKENDVIRHNYTTSKNGDCIQGNNEMPTLDTRCDCLGVVVNDVDKIEYTEKGIVKQNIIPFGSYYTWKDNQGNINTQCNRAANEENYALTIACAETGKVAIKHPSNSILRIRKLTPKECFRLMGVKDCDSKNIKQSDASEFHLAGDSIVSSVLMGLFGELLGIDYKTKIEELVEEIVK